MSETTPREAALERVRELLAEARAKQSSPAPARPWNKHGAFDDMEAARWQIERARDALAGLAALMQPDIQAGNAQLNMARRGDVFAVLDFFAEAMREPLAVLDESANRLEKDLRIGHP